MNGLTTQLEKHVEELLEVLDADIIRIDFTLGRLDEMRASVIRRDEEGLSDLLESIRSDHEDYMKQERRRHAVRCRLAEVIGCGVDEMNLSRMRQAVDPEKASLIAEKQAVLKEKVSKLSIEHRATCMLLRDCSRLNGMLLKSLLGNCRNFVWRN